MKKKTNGIPKAFEQYKQKEVNLILTMLPTHGNVRNLSAALGRSNEAIYMVFHIAYGGKLLKDPLKNMEDHRDNVFTKIAKAKKNLGIFIGHEIK
jgi:hypothetical protein